jgi:hypothetical protein
VVDASTMKEDEYLSDRIESKGTASDEDVASFKEACENCTEDSAVTCKTVFVGKDVIDDWHFRTEMPDAIIYASYTPESSAEASISFDLENMHLTYMTHNERISFMAVDYKIQGRSRDEIMSAATVLAKHIDLLSPLYGYPVPTTDVCVELVNQICELLSFAERCVSYSTTSE